MSDSQSGTVGGIDRQADREIDRKRQTEGHSETGKRDKQTEQTDRRIGTQTEIDKLLDRQAKRQIDKDNQTVRESGKKKQVDRDRQTVRQTNKQHKQIDKTEIKRQKGRQKCRQGHTGRQINRQKDRRTET